MIETVFCYLTLLAMLLYGLYAFGYCTHKSGKNRWLLFCKKLNDASENQFHILEKASANIIRRADLLTEDNIVAEIKSLIS